MPILAVKGLRKAFGGLVAVNGLDFAVDEGEIIGLIGPNGSGKTTVLNLITGSLKPDAGSVVFRGQDVTGLPRYRICQQGIARTFQLIKPFLAFTALQNVIAARAYGHAPAANLRTAARESREILDQVGLGERANVLAKDLALMQLKRLELARALAAKPSLLLLDELMAGLNPAEAEDACCLIKRIRTAGMTIVVVEHIVKAICDISDRVIVLNMGEKICEECPGAIVHNPHVIQVYLGRAYA
jgi:ABC-type branched-subunit amino acid transport system ATPase component